MIDFWVKENFMHSAPIKHSYPAFKRNEDQILFMLICILLCHIFSVLFLLPIGFIRLVFSTHSASILHHTCHGVIQQINGFRDDGAE